METTFGKPIIDALYEEGVNYDAKMEIFFEREVSPTKRVNERALLFVSLETLKRGGIGRVFFPSTGSFSDLWAIWNKQENCIQLFIFSGCERISLTTVRAFRILDDGSCCGNISDEDIVLELEETDDTSGSEV